MDAIGAKAVADYRALQGLPNPAEKQKSDNAKTKQAETPPTPKDELQGAVKRAGERTQEVLAEADKKLSQQIEAAAAGKNADEVKRLTDRQAELRSAIEATKKSSSEQNADLKETLKASEGKRADITAAQEKSAQVSDKEKAAVLAAADRVVQALSERNSATRKAFNYANAGGANSNRGSLLNLTA
jgi:hypothetical protein